jgi:hypothetical protein
MIGGLFATKVVSAAVSRSSDETTDMTATLRSDTIPGEDTLTGLDRNTLLPDAEDASGALPVVSSIVRFTPEPEISAAVKPSQPVARKKSAATRRPIIRATRPAAKQDEPVKAAAIPCRQLDPIARFLVSTKLAPPCAG